jgi:hypothetical protein
MQYSTNIKTMKINKSLIVAMSVLLLCGKLGIAQECKGKKVITIADCATGENHPSCEKQEQSGIPPFCGTSYRTGRTTFSITNAIQQRDCGDSNDPNLKCVKEDADCEQYTEGTCSNYPKLECWGKFNVGTGQYLPVAAGAEGGTKFVIYDVDQVTTLGPTLRGAGHWAHEE